MYSMVWTYSINFIGLKFMMNVSQHCSHQLPCHFRHLSLSRLSSESGCDLSCDSNSLSFLSGQEHLLPLREGCRGNIKEVLRRGRGGDELMTLVDMFPQICTLTLTPTLTPWTSSAKQRKTTSKLYLFVTDTTAVYSASGLLWSTCHTSEESSVCLFGFVPLLFFHTV